MIRNKIKQNVIRRSLNPPVKLHESENAWKPLHKTEGNITAEEKLKRKVQAVLNKLTFQKFKILLVQLKKLNINTEDELNLVVNLIYENAVYEPHFSAVYANLCKHLSMKSNLFGKQAEDFSTCLLTICQQEFEEKCKRNNQTSNDKDEDPKIQLQYEDQRRRAKARRIANIRFIGELCNVKMIPCPILEECIEILLQIEEEESLECLYWLLKTAGKQLDCKQTLVEDYIRQIQAIVDKESTSSRIRCLLKDIIDLNKNNWVPRRIENNPRTIDEIHKEVAIEAQKQMKLFQAILSNAENFIPTTGTNIGVPFERHYEHFEIVDEVQGPFSSAVIETSKDNKENVNTSVNP